VFRHSQWGDHASLSGRGLSAVRADEALDMNITTINNDNFFMQPPKFCQDYMVNLNIKKNKKLFVNNFWIYWVSNAAMFASRKESCVDELRLYSFFGRSIRRYG
jgi:myosin-crossreactive antigen